MAHAYCCGIGDSGQDRPTLVSWTRSSSVKAGLALRARIVLLTSQGVPNSEIAARVGVLRPTMNLWRGDMPVGARNSATLGDLHIFVDHSANSVASDDRDVGGVGLGDCSERSSLAERSVWSMGSEVGFVLGEDSA